MRPDSLVYRQSARRGCLRSGWLTGLAAAFVLAGAGCDSGTDEPACASAKHHTWTTQGRAASAESEFTHQVRIAADRAGNSCIVGSFGGTVAIGSKSLTSKGAHAHDLFVARLGPGGEVLWAVAAGGGGSVWGHGVDLDDAGNCYVTGSFQGQLTLGSISLSGRTDGLSGPFVAKLGPGGKFLWAAAPTGLSSGWGTAIAVDKAGNSHITGTFEHQLTLGSTTLTTDGFELFVTKLSPDGKFLWATSSGGGWTDHSNDIAVDSDGNSYVTGDYTMKATFGSTKLTAAGGEMDQDIFVAKLSPGGAFLWATSAGGTSHYDTGTGIDVDSAGNSYVTGAYHLTASFGATSLTAQRLAKPKFPTSSSDLFVAKVDTAGKFVWAVSAGGIGTEEGKGIAVDTKGNSYVTGYFQSPATFGAASLTSGCTVFVTKLSTGGKLVWAVPASSGRGTGIAVDDTGASYIAGPAELPPYSIDSYRGPKSVYVARIPPKP